MITFPIEEPFHRVAPDVLAGVFELPLIADDMVIVMILPDGFPQSPGGQRFYRIDDLGKGCRARTPGRAISPLKEGPPAIIPRNIYSISQGFTQPKQQMHMVRHDNIAVYMNISINRRNLLYQLLNHSSRRSEPDQGELWEIRLLPRDWPAQGGRPYWGLCLSFSIYGTEDVFSPNSGGKSYKITSRPGIIMAFQSLRPVHPLVFIQHNS